MNGVSIQLPSWCWQNGGANLHCLIVLSWVEDHQPLAPLLPWEGRGGYRVPLVLPQTLTDSGWGWRLCYLLHSMTYHRWREKECQLTWFSPIVAGQVQRPSSLPTLLMGEIGAPPVFARWGIEKINFLLINTTRQRDQSTAFFSRGGV